MKARKLLSLILCAVMVFIAAPASIYADEVQTPEVYVDSVSADPGSDVTVYVGIRNAADLGGLGVKVFYDPDVFTVSSADAGSFVAGASVAVNTSTAGTVSESIIDMNGLNGDGDLMSINFHVDADASPGDYELAVGIDDALDTSFNNISVKKQAGSISVKKAETKPKQVSFYSYFESSGTLRVGDELHYKVNCYDANGLAGGTFTFEYDSNILEFVDAALGDELISDTAIYSVNSNNPGIVKISYAEIEPITTQSDVVFFDITFKAKQKTDASSVTFSGSSLLDPEFNEMMTWGASSNVSIGDIVSRLRTEWDGEEDGDRKFTVDVVLTEGSNVGAGDFWVSYDTSMLTCESVVTDDAVGESGAYLVTKEDTSGGKISFSYVNSKGCSQDTALLHITFKQNHGVTGDTTLETGGKDVVDKAMKDVVLEYPATTLTIPYEYHEEEVMPAVEPTCEETGLTEGKKCSICGEILVEQETVTALGHDYLEDSGSAVEATCETVGKEADMKCSRCGSVIEGKPIEALGHIWSDWTVTKEASCTEDGEEQRICSRDESHVETRKIDAKGHTIEVFPAVPATCEETGLTEGKKCSICGEILVEQETVAALGHDLEKTNGKPVSCTEDGNIEYWTCSRCGKYFSDEAGETEISLEDTVIKTDGHKEEVIPAVPATCEEPGLTEGKKCSVCGEILVEQETVAALGHDYREDSGSAVEATCETAGKEADMKCSRCSSVIEGKPIEALGHIWSDWTVTKEASCTEDGEEQRICSRDDTHVETRKIDATGHTAEVIPAVPATCEEPGLTEGKKCSVCGEILVEQETVAALGHDLEKIESKAVSCTEDGNIEYWTCNRCGKYFSDEAGKTEISLEDTVIKTDGHKEEVIPAVPATCEETGLTEGKKCSICGEILVEQETVAALGHDLEKISGKPVSCTEDGSIEYWTCSRCGKYFSDEAGETEISLEDTVIKATGHEYAEGIVTKEPTEEEEGEITFTCKKCGDSYTKPIPKLDADQAAAYEAVNSADEKVKEAKSQVDKLTEDSSEQTLTDTDLLVAESLEAVVAAVKAAEAAAQKTEAEYGADSDAAKYAQAKLDQAKKAYADASVAAATVKAAIAESAAKKAEEAKKKADIAAATPGTSAAKAAETSLTAAQDAAEKAQAAKDAADAALSAIVAAGYSTDSDEYKAAANAVTSADTRLTEAKAAAEAAEKAKTKADKDAKLEADRQGKRDKKIPKVKGVKVKTKKATITVRWKRFTSKQLKKSKASKYEIWVCPNTKFRKADTKIYTVGKKKSTKVCKGLKRKNAYYVKVRAIKKVKGVKYVGPWSARKKIKTK